MTCRPIENVHVWIGENAGDICMCGGQSRQALERVIVAQRDALVGAVEAERERCALAVNGRMYHAICNPDHPVSADGTFPDDEKCLLCRMLKAIRGGE